jgi:anti-sigma factor RsiW
MLGPYLLGALDVGERDEVEGHLAGCRGCLTEAGELGEAVVALSALPDPQRRVLLGAGAPAGPSPDLPKRR